MFKAVKKYDLSKYKLYLNDLDPKNPYHASIIKKFKKCIKRNKLK